MQKGDQSKEVTKIPPTTTVKTQPKSASIKSEHEIESDEEDNDSINHSATVPASATEKPPKY